ncbi:MAG: glutamate 5-kinase, partial [Oscillospiraceae bacterium]
MEISKSYKRIVVKIGSSTLTHETGLLNLRRIEKLVRVLADVKNSGVQLIIVTSGAVAIGVGKLGFNSRPKEMSAKQACASVGQCELMYMYDKLFSVYNHTVSQVLLSGEDIADPMRRRYVENTLERLLEYGCIPVINENDTVSVKELVIGDNDTLSAIVSTVIAADLLIIMSDIDGLFDSDPRKNPNAKLIPVMDDLDYASSIAGGSGSELGTGGMATKIEAARALRGFGADMVIINGNNPDNIYAAV